MSLSKRYAKTCRILLGSKPVNQGDSVASPASPVQAVGTKIIFLGSSKNEDYSDIDFIHYILVFRKIFPTFFPRHKPLYFRPNCSENYPHETDISFLKKNQQSTEN